MRLFTHWCFRKQQQQQQRRQQQQQRQQDEGQPWREEDDDDEEEEEEEEEDGGGSRRKTGGGGGGGGGGKRKQGLELLQYIFSLKCLWKNCKASTKSHVSNALVTVTVASVVGVVVYFSRDSVRGVLLWVSEQDVWIIVLVYVALFTIVSLPLMWGYIVVNIAAGYMFGTWRGLALTVSTATLGVLLGHLFIRGCLRKVVERHLVKSRLLRSLLLVLGGTHAFRVIVITRLTPIPFGLQNAAFAVSKVPTWLYLCASVLGLFPTQLLNSYLGTTVRNLDDIVSQTSTSSASTTTGWVVFAVQSSSCSNQQCSPGHTITSLPITTLLPVPSSSSSSPNPSQLITTSTTTSPQPQLPPHHNNTTTNNISSTLLPVPSSSSSSPNPSQLTNNISSTLLPVPSSSSSSPNPSQLTNNISSMSTVIPGREGCDHGQGISLGHGSDDEPMGRLFRQVSSSKRRLRILRRLNRMFQHQQITPLPPFVVSDFQSVQ
ncbi:hypothetical protein Pmani_025278 [Petrolisthes manimaculis]|uniref:VTT domain-containing protein n=1 Tax=Petrolisthes manimaculis TaxID=1843537 RepID=A0AAE1TZ36_9EUCA|nr:hypothetical protein Pmani_025278 [Petrolisthes manimaculis]